MDAEKIYTVPFGKAYDYVRTKRARRAVVILQQFICRHSKVAIKNVRISNALNSVIWGQSIQKPPRRIKIKVAKEGDMAKAYLVDEQIKKPEPKKEAKEAKKEAEAVAATPAAKETAPAKAEAKPAEKAPKKAAAPAKAETKA